MDYIRGKNILLVCYPFFGFDVVIKEELLKLGAAHVFLKKAVYFPGSPIDDIAPWYRLPFYYIKDPFARKRWTNTFLEEIQGIHFDILLVIENTSFKQYFIPCLKKQNPDIKTIWFLWDTFKVQQSHHRGYISLFDKVYSFDRDDATTYHLDYFPDFSLLDRQKGESRYNMGFIGSANRGVTEERISSLYKIKMQCQSLGLTYKFHLKYSAIQIKNPIRKCFEKVFPNKYNELVNKYKDQDFMQLNSLSLQEANQILKDSEIIIDFGYKGRQGMTINAVSALVMGKKLITTNYRIINEEFFHPNNILVVDEDNPVIPRQFILSDFKPIDMSHLRIDNWLKHIINS